MLKFILIFLISFSLYGSKILNYNIYDRTDRVDIMVTFDTPFKGIIKQSKKHSKIVIKLYDTEIDSSKIKKLSTKLVRSISITPMFEYTQIVANVPSSVSLIASKTPDAYGLRLRFIDKTLQQDRLITKESRLPTTLASLPTKSETTISTNYYITIALLFLGIIILFIVKKKILKNDKKTNPWLFKGNSDATTIAKEETPTSRYKEDGETKEQEKTVTIRFQKEIDNNTNVVMLDFGKESYLILLGNGNILLDKFKEEKPNSQKAFEDILNARSIELNQIMNEQQQDAVKEPLQIYKEKASSIAYSDE